MEKVRILVDLDETLADFIGGACRVHGVSRQELEQYWEPGTWNIVDPMGYALASKLRLEDGFGWGESSFWQPIHDTGERFWLDLEPLSWAKELVNLIANRSAMIGTSYLLRLGQRKATPAKPVGSKHSSGIGSTDLR